MKGVQRIFKAMATPLAALVTVIMLAACGSYGAYTATVPQVVGGSQSAGKQAIERYACGSCHNIPGIPGAHAVVGPPLNNFAARRFIAGKLPNTPADLEHWVQDPQSVWPGNDMPNMGITDQEARDIAAYLYTLH